MKMDYIIYSLIVIISFLFIHYLIKKDKKKYLGSLPSLMFIVISMFLLGGYFFVNVEERKEKQDIIWILSRLAPTFAYELEQMHHHQLHLNTEEDDIDYLDMINKMVDWMGINPFIDSLYTFRKLPNGDIVFILGPETDYNRNGIIDGKLEERVPLGERYIADIPELQKAFEGEVTFQIDANTDKWGETVSTYAPIYNDRGEVDAIIGIDFLESWNNQVMVARMKAIGLLLTIYFLIMMTYWSIFHFKRAEYRVNSKEKQLLESEGELHFHANYDQLTGLPNALLSNDRLSVAIANANRNKEFIAVIMLDIDDFKYVNNNAGQEIGDIFLKHVGQRISKCVRNGDTVSRFSGDEFTIILLNVNKESIEKITQRIMNIISTPFIISSHEIFVTASLGISLYPQDGEDGNTLINNANVALNQAKEKGKNCIQYYSSMMNDYIQKRVELQSMLHKALERNEFELYFQPQINLKSGHLVGVEALIRWNHPEKGIISPAEFIPLCEEIGLIIPIGEWILMTGCKQVKVWNQYFEEPLRLSINLSATQFKDNNIVNKISRILLDTQFPPELLDLEITESIAIDVENTISKLKLFKSMGVQISIDDFGTGYSSLQYLKKFPVDRLKIDQSFVRDIHHDEDAISIVSTIISMAHNLGLTVIAEGTETQEQIILLQKLLCEEAQGYAFSRPLSVNDFEVKIVGKGSDVFREIILSNS